MSSPSSSPRRSPRVISVKHERRVAIECNQILREAATLVSQPPPCLGAMLAAPEGPPSVKQQHRIAIECNQILRQAATLALQPPFLGAMLAAPEGPPSVKQERRRAKLLHNKNEKKKQIDESNSILDDIIEIADQQLVNSQKLLSLALKLKQKRVNRKLNRFLAKMTRARKLTFDK
jgi:hypothetical protein